MGQPGMTSCEKRKIVNPISFCSSTSLSDPGSRAVSTAPSGEQSRQLSQLAVGSGPQRPVGEMTLPVSGRGALW